MKRGCLGSSFSYIKLVLEVLCLAVKFKLPKLVKFCEDVVEKKITVTSANCQQVLRPNTIVLSMFRHYVRRLQTSVVNVVHVNVSTQI